MNTENHNHPSTNNAAPRIRNLLAARMIPRGVRRRSFVPLEDGCSVLTEDDVVTPATVTAPKSDDQQHYVVPTTKLLQLHHRHVSQKSFSSKTTLQADNTSSSHLANNFFTFRRQYDENTVRETTVQANVGPPKKRRNSEKRRNSGTSGHSEKTIGTAETTDLSTTTDDDEEDESLDTNNNEGDTMQDLVKRLQAQPGAKQVFVFTKEEATAIASGKKRFVFSLPQVPKARFAKEEFGDMTAASVLQLTDERPVVVELLAEDVVEGESIHVF